MRKPFFRSITILVIVSALAVIFQNCSGFSQSLRSASSGNGEGYGGMRTIDTRFRSARGACDGGDAGVSVIGKSEDGKFWLLRDNCADLSLPQQISQNDVSWSESNEYYLGYKRILFSKYPASTGGPANGALPAGTPVLEKLCRYSNKSTLPYEVIDISIFAGVGGSQSVSVAVSQAQSDVSPYAKVLDRSFDVTANQTGYDGGNLTAPEHFTLDNDARVSFSLGGLSRDADVACFDN